ncbi:sporulation protein YqfD [Cohnella sp. AR92]|uniref:sporulation protein YqfD n=1 Tax=Cohnella sp. AR92 TaxID=648716 RepID=UPI0013152336|nr:sporulation protein YqfD [Cohnella sp. AR92]
MKGSWFQYVKGFVRVKLTKGDAEQFLNEALKNRLELWNLSFAAERKLVFYVAIPDYFRLRPLLRAVKGRTRILERHGLPFQMARLSRRKTFAFGMLGFVLALYLMSTLIWDVKAEGTATITKEQILAAARAEGVRPFQWSFRLPDTSDLAGRIAQRLPNATWVGVEKQGTRLGITVIESTRPEPSKLQGPRDLIASADAVITRIVAENGRPKVKRNDRVRKGDVLISGIVGEGERTQTVISKGEVRGLVWYEYKIASPLEREVKAYTGEEITRKYWLIGNRALQVTGYKAPTYELSDTRAEYKRLKLWRWTLPLGNGVEKEKEVVIQRESMTEAEAKSAGLAQARQELLAKCGEGAVIKAEKLLHEQTENGKVVINVLFEVEQSIALERPIIQYNVPPTSIEQGE